MHAVLLRTRLGLTGSIPEGERLKVPAHETRLITWGSGPKGLRCAEGRVSELQGNLSYLKGAEVQEWTKRWHILFDRWF